MKNLQKIFSCSQSKFIIILLLALFSCTSFPFTLRAKSQQPTSSTPRELGGVKGKGEGGKGLNPLPFSLSPFPSPHLAFLGWQTTSGNQPPQDGSSRGRPSQRGGAGSRGNCPSVQVPLIALIPEKKVGLVVEGNPTFWVFVPYQPNDVPSGEFVLQDEANNDVYRASFTLPNIPGIVSLSLPSTVSLEVNKAYQWYFKVYCNQQQFDPVFVRGWVQRIALTSNLERQLKATNTVGDRIQLYTQNDIWYSALAELAKLRITEPQNAALNNEWISLLRDIELENLAQKPLVGEVKIKQ
ncbi:MAG: DUF928 domain-containing protein [Nostoc sp. DedVER02]|uniref:DUF928 domain-containing protein n=1 Tax=unclassified Nostoc TaxID=2593658 RepID=UPI002AD3F712|nr:MULTISPECIES: DUF928 domain-containing protein [unclassified Nostoc]MDZ7988956.1 DUF928 domain-containing protein [Nostoc sp. DedVER02]MDZ8114750.1 DUF928 domain-containing protein [Nostoc sp. DedVER01b]